MVLIAVRMIANHQRQLAKWFDIWNGIVGI